METIPASERRTLEEYFRGPKSRFLEELFFAESDQMLAARLKISPTAVAAYRLAMAEKINQPKENRVNQSLTHSYSFGFAQ